MNILITGGTGFIGSNIVKELMKEDHNIIITGHDAENRIKDFKGKYLQPSFLGLDWDSLPQVDVLFHQAAINDTTNLDKKEMIQSNLESSKKLFNEVVKRGCKNIVYASSTAVYGDALTPYEVDGPKNPLNPYGESKLLLDDFAMDFAKEYPEVTIIGLRYCNVYGPGEAHKNFRSSMIFQLAQQMKVKDPKLFKDGEQKREWIYIKDVVKANLLASKATTSCVVNCGTGSPVTFNQIVQTLNQVLQTNRTPIYIDNPFKDRYQNHTECNMEKTKELINFEPDFNLQSGIQDFFDSKEL